MLVIVQNIDLVILHQGLTFAAAPRSIARRRSADGNRFFMASIRPPGSFALLSSSSNTSKYVSVNAAAVLASRGAPALLCPGLPVSGLRSTARTSCPVAAARHRRAFRSDHLLPSRERSRGQVRLA